MTTPLPPLRAVIVDDEEHCVKTLAWELEAAEPRCEVLATFTDSSLAVHQLARLAPDLLFLDIEMPQLNGFELLTRLETLGTRTPNVIFTTAYSDYAVKAFKYSAVDYLLKPVDREELEKALRRVPRDADVSPESESGGLKVLFDNMASEKHGRPMRISLPTGEGWELVSIDEIVRCQSDGSYTDIHLATGRTITISRNLKQIEESLSSAPFHRVHHSHLVNFDHVKRFVRQDGGTLIMSDGGEVAVARSRKDEVLALLR